MLPTFLAKATLLIHLYSVHSKWLKLWETSVIIFNLCIILQAEKNTKNEATHQPI